MHVVIALDLFFFQAEDGIRDRNVTGVQTCALPISDSSTLSTRAARGPCCRRERKLASCSRVPIDRKSTRLNSSHVSISYAVFRLNKKILAVCRIVNHPLITAYWPETLRSLTRKASL